VMRCLVYGLSQFNSRQETADQAHSARLLRAHSHLSKGDFDLGFRAYPSRLGTSGAAQRKVPTLSPAFGFTGRRCARDRAFLPLSRRR
jgi:hypothetical protein